MSQFHFVFLGKKTLWICKFLQILKKIVQDQNASVLMDSIEDVAIGANREEAKHCQLFRFRHYSLQSNEGMWAFWWQQCFGFCFCFNIFYLLDQALDFRSLHPSSSLVQMYPDFLCSSSSLFLFHFLFLLPHPCSEASQTWQELLGSSQLLLHTQVVLSRHSPAAGWGWIAGCKPKPNCDAPESTTHRCCCCRREPLHSHHPHRWVRTPSQVRHLNGSVNSTLCQSEHIPFGSSPLDQCLFHQNRARAPSALFTGLRQWLSSSVPQYSTPFSLLTFHQGLRE